MDGPQYEITDKLVWVHAWDPLITYVGPLMHLTKLALVPVVHPWARTKISTVPLYPMPVLLRIPCSTPGWPIWDNNL